MKGRHWSALAGAAAIMTVIAGVAMAQGPGGMEGRGWWGEGRGSWWGGPWRHGPAAMIDRVERRLAFVKAELKITEAQTPAWNEVAEAVRNTAKHRNERMQALFSGSTKTDSLPERLDVHEKLLSVILDDVKQIKGGVSKLYAVLSDEQKEEADDIVLPMVGIGMGRWGWHHWRD